MANNLTVEIGNWIEVNGTGIKSKQELVKGAELLLQCNSNKMMYNYIMQNKVSAVAADKLIYELKKHHKIKLSSITLKQIEEMKPKVEAIGKDIEKQPKLTNKEEQSGFKGKRKDHDLLPDEIKALYEATLNILQKERQLHEKLKLMENAPACDRHEFTLQLTELDTKRCGAWEKYDNFDLDKYLEETAKKEKKMESLSTEEVTKTIAQSRSYISKAIPKLNTLKKSDLNVAEYKELLAIVQGKYDNAVKLGATFKDDYKEKLLNVGIKV